MAPYDPTVIKFIGSLDDAHIATSSEAFGDFLTIYQEAAREYDLHDRYGVSLVHRHTDVPPGQRIFDFGHTLQPYPLHNHASDLYGAKIRPKSFALRGSEWTPYESELGEPDEDTQEFFEAAKSLIERFGLGQSIGLRRYSPDDPEELEITESGGISIKIPWDSVCGISATSY